MEIKRPLAYRARPKILDDIVRQIHIVGKNGVVRRMINNDQMFSLILYGPPGVGKTTIATVIAENFGINTYKFPLMIGSGVYIMKYDITITVPKLYKALISVVWTTPPPPGHKIMGIKHLERRRPFYLQK